MLFETKDRQQRKVQIYYFSEFISIAMFNLKAHPLIALPHGIDLNGI
jgi:hypothetical protein